MYKWFPKIHLPFELNFSFLDRLDDNWVTVFSFLQSLWKWVIWIWEFEFNKILYMTVAELLWIPVAKMLAQFDIIYPRYCLYLLVSELLLESPSLTLPKGGQNTVFVCFNTTCGENVSKTGLYLGEYGPKKKKKKRVRFMNSELVQKTLELDNHNFCTDETYYDYVSL